MSRSNKERAKSSLNSKAQQSPSSKKQVNIKFLDKVKVLFYLANIIDFIRILCVFFAFIFSSKYVTITYILYSCSTILDCFDGLAARKLKQLSRFGAILDMVTDRISTTLLAVLIARYAPKLTSLMQLSIAIDVASHMFYVYKQQIVSSNEHSKASKNHKFVKNTDNWILKRYYGSKIVLGTLCTLNEIFFIALFVFITQIYGDGSILNQFWVILSEIALVATFPGHVIKQIVNISQLANACNGIIISDVMEKKK